MEPGSTPLSTTEAAPFLTEAALRQMDSWVKENEGTSMTDFQTMRAAAFVHEQVLAASQPKLPPGHGIPSPTSRSDSPPAPVPPNLSGYDVPINGGGVGLSSDLLASANVRPHPTPPNHLPHLPFRARGGPLVPCDHSRPVPDCHHPACSVVWGVGLLFPPPPCLSALPMR